MRLVDKALCPGLRQSCDYIVEGFLEHASRRSQQVSDHSIAKASRSPGDSLRSAACRSTSSLSLNALLRLACANTL